VREFLGTLGCRPSLKLLQDRGQTFRDGLLGGIQLGPERSPDCQQPRHSLCALIKPRRSTTFVFLVASSVKFGGINGHDDLGFTIIFDGRSLCDSSRSASAHSGPLTSRPSWAIMQRSACRCRRPYRRVFTDISRSLRIRCCSARLELCRRRKALHAPQQTAQPYSRPALAQPRRFDRHQ
jgi:hypothetical protein